MDVCFNDPMDYGMGIDSLTLRPRNPFAVTATNLKEVRGSGGAQTVEYSLVNAETMEDFESSFSINAEAAATYGMFGGSASFDFGKTHKFHSYSHFLLVRVTVTNANKQIDKPKLNPDTNATALLQEGHEDKFQKEFGDSFVLGIRQGGVFHAILEFSSSFQEDLEKIRSTVSAATLGAAGRAKISSDLNDLKEHTNLKVYSFQQGGSGPTVADIDGIINRSLIFSDQVKDAAASYSIQLLDYGAIDLPNPPNQVKVENARNVIQRYYKLRTEIMQLLNDIEYIKAHPTEFLKSDGFKFDEAENILTESLNALMASASRCADDVNACSFIPVQIPDIELPQRLGIKEILEAYAQKGASLADEDTMFALIRSKQPEGPNRTGLDIGLGIAHGDTLPGPGKDKFGHDWVLPASQDGYRLGVLLAVGRNKDLEYYTRGSAVVKADPATAAARGVLASEEAWLGFTIGSGIFGRKDLGGMGNTLPGSGSDRVRDGLSDLAQQGFNSAVAFHLHR